MGGDPDNSLSDGVTLAGHAERRPAGGSLGDDRTLGGDTAELDAVIDDIEIVDLESRYHVDGMLGQGGMGAVLLATDTRLDRKVAIKRILGAAAGNRIAVQRFLTEAKAIAALNHPNIVQIHDYGQATDGPFLIMEYVDGGSLLDRCRDAALPLDEAIDLACHICDGLAKAHDLGIIHRDIKPANVLITRDGIPKLTDFGLAKAQASDHGQTVAGAVLGTPDFMSPEQRRDAGEVDHRSDLWSLAATVYQMVTGRSPKIIRFDLLPASLTTVLGKAFEDEKERRFQSARDFRDALRMSMRGAAAAVEELVQGRCSSCNAKNDPSRRFCRGCGESLEAPCLSCSKPMPLWEEICGSCGARQTPLVQQRHDQMAATQAQAEEFFGDLLFDQAMQLAAGLRDEPHPRLAHLKGWATSFLGQVERTRADQLGRARHAIREAVAHERAYDYAAGMRVLSSVPASVREAAAGDGRRETAAAMLRRLESKLDESNSLDTSIRGAIKAKALAGLLPKVRRLAELRPDRSDVTKVQQQLEERLQRLSARRDELAEQSRQAFEGQDYAAALALFSQIDPEVMTESLTAYGATITSAHERAQMLRDQIKSAVADHRYDGLLDVVEQYLALKPITPDLEKLRSSLEKREERLAAEERARAVQRREAAGRLAPAIAATALAVLVAEMLYSHRRTEPMQMLLRLDGGSPKSLLLARVVLACLVGAVAKWSLPFAFAIYDSLQPDTRNWIRPFVRRIAVAGVLLALASLVGSGVVYWREQTAVGPRSRSSVRDASLGSAMEQGPRDNAPAIAPQSAAALVGRARAKLQANPADIDGAFADLETAERQPEAAAAVRHATAEAHAARAAAEARAGRLDRAAQEVEAAVRGGANKRMLVLAHAAITEAWLARVQQAVAAGDGDAIRSSADAALAAGADRASVLGLWREYVKGRIVKLDGKGVELACAESKKVGLAGADECEWWIRFGNNAAAPPHENAAEVIRAANAALAAGADRASVLGLWKEYVKGRIAKLDGKGVELACAESKKVGLAGADECEWWIQFGHHAASPPHENASEVIRAANAALAAGASAAAVAPLQASGMAINAIAAQRQGNSKAAVSGILAAFLLDAAIVEATLANPANAALRTAVVADYRGQFEEAIRQQDWQQALQISAAAATVDRLAREWGSDVVELLSRDEVSRLPPIRNSIGMELKLLPAGTFTMGQLWGEENEIPHTVKLTKPFYIGVCEVTNAQWKQVVGNVPSRWQDDTRPVEQVSWEEATEFCKKLSAIPEERKTGREYRLPTEAEWEYACRAGTTTMYSFGNDKSKLGEYAWFVGNSARQTNPVGQKQPNAWGLHDMHGNVWEWCSDWFDVYSRHEVTDPQGPSGASVRVYRGGCWNDVLGDCRSATRSGSGPSNRGDGCGFRLALSLFGTELPEPAGKRR